MSLPNQDKSWKGNQPQTYTNADRTMKPVPNKCDSQAQHQFSDNESAASFGADNYYEPTFDKWNNVIVNDDRGLHREATPGLGQYGDRQFASNSQDINSTGYGNQYGINEIPYNDQSAAFTVPEKVVVDVSRADRGRES